MTGEGLQAPFPFLVTAAAVQEQPGSTNSRGKNVLDRICGNRRRCQFYGCNRWLYGVDAMTRLVIYFILGLLLGTATVLAHAETQPAVQKSTPAIPTYSGLGWNNQQFEGGSVLDVCQQIATTTLSRTLTGADGLTCLFSDGAIRPVGAVYKCGTQTAYSPFSCVVFTCPDSTWSLTGQTCTRADSCPTYPPSTPDSLSATQPSNCSCPAGTSWYAYNGCRKTCGGNQPTGEVANSGFGVAIADGATEGCFQGCLVQHKAGGYDQYKGYKMATATWSKWACNGNGLGTGPTPNDQPTPDAQTQDPSKKKDPPCAAGDGVITSSSGGVKCLPEGTPNTSKPSVEKKTKTETFPDNSTKTTTETTTRDPNTNATSVSTTTTSTGGQSGPAGTSTSQEGTTGKVGGGNGNGDGDGSCDPTLNFCGGPGTDGLYTKKEKTLESVFSTFQTTVKGSPIGSASTSFFAVSTPSGGCPGWSVTVPMLNITLDGSSFFCNGSVIQAMNAAGAVLLALATYIAFTWAFL